MNTASTIGNIIPDCAFCDNAITTPTAYCATKPIGIVVNQMTVGDGRTALVAEDRSAGPIVVCSRACLVLHKRRVTIQNGQAIYDRTSSFTGVEIKPAVWFVFCAITVYDAVLRAIFAAKCNGLSPEVDIAVALAGVCTIGDDYDITTSGNLYCGLNSFVRRGYV